MPSDGGLSKAIEVALSIIFSHAQPDLLESSQPAANGARQTSSLSLPDPPVLSEELHTMFRILLAIPVVGKEIESIAKRGLRNTPDEKSDG